MSGILLLTATIQGKAQVNTYSNISTQPLWGPEGYQQADYYYLPDVESYYSVATHQFIYLDGGRWVFMNKLPQKYAHYDLYSGYKAVINRPRPYLDVAHDRINYARYRGLHGKQVAIRDSHNPKYMRHVKRNDNGRDYGP